MNDRELLELAAKAAGIDGEYKTLSHSRRDHFKQIRNFSREAFVSKGLVWDPLTDDGDALRLAVKLGMNIEITDSTVFACSRGNFYEDAKPNPEAATRRAIVRAAAEIGRAMP
ncbi:hypothetical protein [Pseudomonas sp. MONT-RG-20F-20-E-7-02]|uniref:hypothetical protein n=1 Tax=Pseudomonas sp. MONT-RG-20F-20-E-7-02 TaxID=2914979 RepID=UPI001F58F3E4|nr:hypothetical protein [Pseudomonas sp. MONT-RG-20F-20-E-7-02]